MFHRYSIIRWLGKNEQDPTWQNLIRTAETLSFPYRNFFTGWEQSTESERRNHSDSVDRHSSQFAGATVARSELGSQPIRDKKKIL